MARAKKQPACGGALAAFVSQKEAAHSMQRRRAYYINDDVFLLLPSPGTTISHTALSTKERKIPGTKKRQLQVSPRSQTNKNIKHRMQQVEKMNF